ncbi:response regulator, partial [Pandoraea pneumonica]
MELVDILQDAGFRCHSADDGDAAKEMLPLYAESIILLFADVDMPGGTDGFELARHVAERYPWIEIVIASERVTPRDGDLPPKATFI